MVWWSPHPNPSIEGHAMNATHPFQSTDLLAPPHAACCALPLEQLNPADPKSLWMTPWGFIL